MSLRDKLKAKTAGLGAKAEAELAASGTTEKTMLARTAVGQAGAFQVAITERDRRVTELEARVKDLESSSTSVAAIEPNPWQPRRVFAEDTLQELADSIAEVGLVQPIVIRRKPSVQNLDTIKYQLVAGERRWRAHRLIGKTDIRVIVIDATDEEMAALALAENLDRADLTAYEVAIAIRNAEAAFPNRKSLARALGMQRSDLYRYLAFFQLPTVIIDDLEQTPSLLGRDAAEQIVSVIKKHGDTATDAVSRIWTRVVSGDLDQGKIAATVETTVTKLTAPKTERDIRKLFKGKVQAGSITRDVTGLTVKIRAATLTQEMESKLRLFVEGMFSVGPTSQR